MPKVKNKFKLMLTINAEDHSDVVMTHDGSLTATDHVRLANIESALETIIGAVLDCDVSLISSNDFPARFAKSFTVNRRKVPESILSTASTKIEQLT